MKQLMPIIILVVCVSMYFVYIKPEMATISEKRAHYTEYKKVIDEVQEIKAKREQLSAQYNSISPTDIDKINKIIPEKFDPVVFANDLNALASEYGISITSIRTDYSVANDKITDDTQVGDNPYRIIVVGFHVRGEYGKFLSFLEELETSLRLMDVTKLDIRGGAAADPKQKSSVINLEYEVELKTYSLK